MADLTIMALERPAKTAKGSKKSAANNEQRERVFDVFRRWGYYEATLDPLDVFQPQKLADLELTGEAAEEARRIYCGNVGVEFMHLPEPERRRWIAERIEGPELEVNQEKILERLVRADLFEQVLQARYLGTKRFSLEGVTSLIPLLDSLLDTAGDFGAVDCVMAMSHRGRLNVMVHAACKPPNEVVAGFEDVDPRSVLGAGDVKYHHGADGVYETPIGTKTTRGSNPFAARTPRSTSAMPTGLSSAMLKTPRACPLMSSPSASATARPIPRTAPVTSAVLPSRRNGFSGVGTRGLLCGPSCYRTPREAQRSQKDLQ